MGVILFTGETSRVIPAEGLRLHYQIYTIPYGDPSPLVCQLDHGYLPSQRWPPNTIQETTSSRESFADPVKAANDFVFEHVRKIVEKKALPISGHILSSDILFAFVDLYNRCLNIKPEQDHYSVKDLEYAFNLYLIQICAAFVSRIPKGDSRVLVDLDSLSHYLSTTPIKPVAPVTTTSNFGIISRSFPIKAAFDALRYLLANQITSIERPFGRRDVPLSNGRNWIWSGYSRKNEIESITRILDEAFKEYSEFVTYNKFRFPNSPYLDSDTSVILEYEPVGTTKYGGPGLNEYHIDNTRHTLPKNQVIIGDPEHPRLDLIKFPIVEFDGKQHTLHSSSLSVATFLFSRPPVLNLVYRMLINDLSRHYKMTLSSTIFY
ncbi:MAG: hypothetical protein AB1597_01585 [Chloroflexota bacterium]